MVRASLTAKALGAGGSDESDQGLEIVERFFGGPNSDLALWQRLTPMPGQDRAPAAGRTVRPSPVVPHTPIGGVLGQQRMHPAWRGLRGLLRQRPARRASPRLRAE